MILLQAMGWMPVLHADLSQERWLWLRNMAVVVGALLIGTLVIALVARWRKRSGSTGLSASDQLAEFRSLYLAGEISKEEFDKLRALLGGQLRGELDVPPPAAVFGGQLRRDRDVPPPAADTAAITPARPPGQAQRDVDVPPTDRGA